MDSLARDPSTFHELIPSYQPLIDRWLCEAYHVVRLHRQLFLSVPTISSLCLDATRHMASPVDASMLGWPSFLFPAGIRLWPSSLCREGLTPLSAHALSNATLLQPLPGQHTLSCHCVHACLPCLSPACRLLLPSLRHTVMPNGSALARPHTARTPAWAARATCVT